MEHAYSQVDVFTSTALLGNPLAVVHDAAGLSDAQMQAFARWTQLSETTYVLPPTEPGADYRVRIFTPAGELPFAGHPTLGTCHAWLLEGGRPRDPLQIVQQCGVGLVRIRRDRERLAFAAPAMRRRDVSGGEIEPVLGALGLARAQVLDAQWLDNGPTWLGLLLDGAATVLALEPDHRRMERLAKVGVIGAHPRGAPAHFEVRAFAASIGVAEDPVTGSLNASLAQWLMAQRRAPASYRVCQGTRLARAGEVHLDCLDEQV